MSLEPSEFIDKINICVLQLFNRFDNEKGFACVHSSFNA